MVVVVVGVVGVVLVAVGGGGVDGVGDCVGAVVVVLVRQPPEDAYS